MASADMSCVACLQLTKEMKKQHEHCMQCVTAFDEVHLCKHDVSLQKQFTLVAFASVSTQHASNKTSMMEETTEAS